MTCLLSGDLFSVDRERAYNKITEDMVSENGGWLRELIANAIDALTESGACGDAIRLELLRQPDACRMRVTDAGTGMEMHHIEALHYMGRTTKKKVEAHGVRTAIGQFGLGFMSVFAKRNKVREVNIYTRTRNGECRRISIKNKDDRAVPLWREFDVRDGDPVPDKHGTCFEFIMAASQYDVLFRLLANMCFQTIIPIEFNGTRYANTPRDLLSRFHYMVAEEAVDPEGHITVVLAASYGPRDDDSAALYLRSMLTEIGSAHEMFGLGGDKFTGRAYGRPYLPDEKMIVLSQVGEATLSRDKIVRDKDHERMTTIVNAARAKAVAALLNQAARKKAESWDQPVEDTYLANLETLYRHLAAYLERRDYPSELQPALEAVAQFPFFRVHESATRYSLAELYTMRSTRHGIYLHAESPDVAQQFSHTSPVTLKEMDLCCRPVFGYWRKSLCGNILADVFKALSTTEPKPTLHAMEAVMANATLAVELEKKGVIQRTDYNVKATDLSDAKMTGWFEALRTMLNQNWFRNGLTEYHEIRKIRLMPVVVTDTTAMDSEFLAMELRVPDAEADEYVIGIRTDSSAARTLADAGTERENLLPAVIQIASCISKHHYGRFILEQDATMQVAHTRDLLVDMVGLEDRIIQRALRVLNNGQDDAQTSEHQPIFL